MKTKDYYNPLWVINLKTKDHISKKELFSLEEQIEALSYLETMNADFQKFTDLYFRNIEKTPEIVKTLEDIQDRFTSLRKWIFIVKTLLNSLK